MLCILINLRMFLQSLLFLNVLFVIIILSLQYYVKIELMMPSEIFLWIALFIYLFAGNISSG